MGNAWGLILAGGEGRRLHSMTTIPSGMTVPKQYCSLCGGDSLLEDALNRAAAVVPRERVCTIVSAEHGRWWRAMSLGLAPQNLFIQPRNRGTAAGILLPLLHLVRRDPRGTLIILPSDHHFANEATLLQALKSAVALAQGDPEAVLLLGIHPAEPNPELGYILPECAPSDIPARIACFVEKPEPSTARTLIAAGALWNTFISVASFKALLALFEKKAPDLVARMREALGSCIESSRSSAETSLERLYGQMDSLDFSRAILTGQESSLRMVEVPECGWHDLGTPMSVAAALARAPPRTMSPPPAHPAVLNLKVQHDRHVAQ